MLPPLLLALSLGQACPPPSSPRDPPPCAVADAPGCLPGYRPRLDPWGRVIYACDRNYLPPPGEAPVAPASARALAIAAPPEARAAAAPEGRGHVGVVFMPGVSAFPSFTRLDETKAQGQIALEFRGTEGGGRVRLVGDYTSFGRIGELSVKYDFLDGFFLRPFLALGLGIASINPDPGVRASASASAGVDLYLSRDFFLTGELRGRVFTEGTSGPAHGLAISDRRQTSLLAGMGFYAF